MAKSPLAGITKVETWTIPLRDTGGDGPPVLFLHGLLVDGSIWDPVVERLPGHRCLVPELPLGSHTTPFPDRSRLTPQGVANLAADVLDARPRGRHARRQRHLRRARAAIVTSRPERIGRLVLTPCDAFETFPPPLFKLLFVLGRTAFGLNAASSRCASPSAAGCRSRTGSYQARQRRPAQALDRRRRCTSRGATGPGALIRHCSTPITLDAAAKLPAFDKPVTIAWPPGDPAFPFSLADLLVTDVPRARLVEVADSLAFVSIDQPDVLARLISVAPGPS